MMMMMMMMMIIISLKYIVFFNLLCMCNMYFGIFL